jgi:molybdenum cofactor cytidylyltransferase
MAHFRTPRNRGSLREPTIAQEGTNPLCGDRVRIELLVEDGTVLDARFTANACAICVASASMLTELVQNAPLDEVETLTVDDVLKSLKAEIPSGRVNCVRLPLTVMHTGVHRFRQRSANATGGPAPGRIVAAIVLAAGLARRFGAQKLLAPFGDSTVLRNAVERVRASAVDRVVVVVGPGADALRGALSGLKVDWATNADPTRGMSSSIITGLAALSPNVEAVVVVLGDQPTVDEQVLDGLLRTWAAGGASIVAPRYRGKRGHPVLFDRALFSELRALEGDRGARDFIDAHPALLEVVDVDAAVPLDVDTAADYDTLLRERRVGR